MSASALQTLKALFAPTDEQLMWRVQTTGDQAAFAELVQRWQVPIQRLCSRLTGDSHQGEDVAQEVFARLYLHRDSFRQGSKLSTYLWRIALNLSYNELRRPRRRRETAFEPPVESDAAPFEPACELPAPDTATAASETAALVREAMLSLPEEYRTVLVLRHYEDLKYREIADVLGIPEGTVKTRMTEALSEMARRLRRPLDLKMAPPPDRRARAREMLVL